MDEKVDDEVKVWGGYATGGVEEGEPKGNPDEKDELVVVELEEFFLKENASVLRKLVESGLGLRTKGDEEREVVFEGVSAVVVAVVVAAVAIEGEEEEEGEEVKAGAVGVVAGVMKAGVMVVVALFLLRKEEAVVVVGFLSFVLLLVVKVVVVVGGEVGNFGGDKCPSRRGLDGAESGWRWWLSLRLLWCGDCCCCMVVVV